MDEFDATSKLFNKIKSIDPENASKIMGYILIQDVKERDLVRLAFGPETLLQSLILKAKIHLGLSSNTLSTPTSPSLSPMTRRNTNTSNTNNNVNKNPFAKLSSRITSNGFLDFAKNPSLSDPKSSPFLSYENIRAGSSLVPSVSHLKNGVVAVGDSGCSSGNSGSDFIEELQFNDYLSFLDESSKNEEFTGPRGQMSGEVTNWGQDVNNVDTHLHRRSFSASDACFGTEDASCFSIGYRPCLYFARGFCKNGENCKFLHGGFGDNFDANGVSVGSPSKMDGLYLQHEGMMRLKAAQLQRLAASQFAAGVSPLPYDKCMDFLLQQQNDPPRAAAAAVMLGEEFYKFGHGRPDRNDLLAMGLAEKVNSANRQIYLTFPADSSFKDEDVSNYFSNFGPVQDVRIPYQSKRMFGFVTFVYPETVKLILARGNPHFICDSRVLVKPYKEKGKIAEKRQHQFERGNLSPCSSPSGVDSRDPYDLNLGKCRSKHAFSPAATRLVALRKGAKMFYQSQEIVLRKKLEEQAELQQAIEFQRRRFVNLELPNVKNDYVHHHQRSLSVGSPITLPNNTDVNQNLILPSGGLDQEALTGDSLTANVPSTICAATEHAQHEANAACIQKNGCGNSEEEDSHPVECDLHERSHESRVELGLPESLFASTEKPAECQIPVFSTSGAVNEGAAILATPSSESNPEMPITSTTNMASH